MQFADRGHALVDQPAPHRVHLAAGAQREEGGQRARKARDRNAQTRYQVAHAMIPSGRLERAEALVPKGLTPRAKGERGAMGSVQASDLDCSNALEPNGLSQNGYGYIYIYMPVHLERKVVFNRPER